MGSKKSIDFLSYNFSPTQSTAIRNPETTLVAFTTRVNPVKILHQRTVYGIFDWLGDIGGFIEALYFMGKIILFTF
jgi:hypothetical protein